MRWIVASSLRFRYIVVGIAAAFLFFGTHQVQGEKVDVFPEFAPTRVEIQTACVGLSSSEVEELVSVPLEDALNGVPGVDVIRSTSVPTLPTWAAPPFMMQPVSATSRIMKVGLTSNSMSLMDLSLTAYWNIRARLLRVPGVANVAIWGERLQMMTVQVDPHRMNAKGATLEQVMESTAGAVDSGLLKFSTGSIIGTGGNVETPNQRLSVRNVLPVVTPSDLAKVPVDGAKAAGTRLGDLGTVQYANQPLFGDAVINGKPGLL